MDTRTLHKDSKGTTVASTSILNIVHPEQLCWLKKGLGMMDYHWSRNYRTTNLTCDTAEDCCWDRLVTGLAQLHGSLAAAQGHGSAKREFHHDSNSLPNVNPIAMGSRPRILHVLPCQPISPASLRARKGVSHETHNNLDPRLLRVKAWASSNPATTVDMGRFAI